MADSVFPGEQPDRLEEECGVFGVYAPGEDVARLTCYGLQALQHRGQESAGIAVGDGSTVIEAKDLGLVTQVFDEATLAGLGEGVVAIGTCAIPRAAGRPPGRRPSRISPPSTTRSSRWPTTARS